MFSDVDAVYIDPLLYKPELSLDGITIYGIMDPYYSAAIDMKGKEIWNSGYKDLVYYYFSTEGDYFGCLYHDKNIIQYKSIYIGRGVILADGYTGHYFPMFCMGCYIDGKAKTL